MAENSYTKAWKSLLMAESDQIVELPVLSGSMHPLIQTKDLLQIQPCQAQDLHLGDIAVFSVKNRIFAHRVIFVLRLKNRQLLLEKGIQNKYPGWLSPGQILGRGLGVKRGGQSISFRGLENRRVQRVQSQRELLAVLLQWAFIPARIIARLLKKG